MRPKLMTVATMLLGLVPLLWATGSGSDVMKRIAAPMVGGLLTSAFLTLEIIPVIYTYWRQEQLLWERLGEIDQRKLGQLVALAYAIAVGFALASVIALLTLYFRIPRLALTGSLVVAVTAIAACLVAYLALRPAARRLVWP